MYNIPWYILVFISIPQTLLILGFGFCLFNIRLKYKHVLLLAFLITGICYLLRFTSIPYGLNTIILVILFTLLVALISRVKLKYAFNAVLLGVLIYGMLEGVLLPIIAGVLNITLTDIAVSSWHNLIAFFPIALVGTLLLIVIIKRQVVLYDFSNREIPITTWRVIAVILVQTECLILLSTSIFASPEFSAYKTALPYLNAVLVVLCLFSLLAIKSMENQSKQLIQSVLQKNHLHQMENILKSAEIKQHEYTKHMQIIQALIELQKFDKALEYINGINDQYYVANIYYEIKNTAVAALINSKNSVAHVKNIDFAVAQKCNLSGISIPDWELCSMLGNLLDNAFEAALNEEHPRVGLEFRYEKGFYAIYIINNGSRIKEPNRIFEAGYTTKGSEGRGYGLYIVKKLADRYRGTIEIITKPKTTIILRFPRVGEHYDKNINLKSS